MKQSLQLKMGQQLTMTPQLQQAIRLLQLSTLDLQQEIQEALDSNPMLEVEENLEETFDNNAKEDQTGATEERRDNLPDELTSAEPASTSTAAEAEGPAADSEWSESIPEDLPVDTSWDDVYESSASTLPASNYDGDDSDFESRRGHTETLFDHLMWQLNLTTISPRDEIIALAIIDAVQPSGLLSCTIEDIHQGLTSSLDDLELDEVQAVQRRLQQFDPCGVCSVDLVDCLLVQLAQLDKDTPFLEAAQLIVQQYLPQLASRDYRQLMRRTRLKEPELAEAVALIKSLTPHPGDSISSRDRKSTRLNSSHVRISYAVFCLKKKITNYRALILVSGRSPGPGLPLSAFLPQSAFLSVAAASCRALRGPAASVVRRRGSRLRVL